MKNYIYHDLAPFTSSITIPASETNNISFHCGSPSKEILRLDSQGMTYNGQRIEDAGKAHQAFVEAMNVIRNTPISI